MMRSNQKTEFCNRFARNRGTVMAAEQELLMQKSVCIIGCGGLGGGIIENLTRLGVGRLTVVDGDVFDETNLNRQVLSNEHNLGKAKAAEAAAQMKLINSEVTINAVTDRLDEKNCAKVIAGHDLVIDAVDNINTRLLLESACEAEKITLVHGAIAGWSGQVAVIRPGDGLLHKIYDGEKSAAGSDDLQADKGSETETGNPSFTPAVISGMQTAETLKVLLGRDGILENKMLMMDLLTHEYEIIEF